MTTIWSQKNPELALLFETFQLCALLFGILLLVDCFAAYISHVERPKHRILFNLLGAASHALIYVNAGQIVEILQ